MSGWTEQDIVERGERFLSEQERVRAAKGFVGALSEMAVPRRDYPTRCEDGSIIVNSTGQVQARSSSAVDPIKRAGRIRGIADKVDRTYDGRLYMSRAEMLYAAKLDLLLKAGKIQRVEPQVRIPLVVNKELVCTMVADFLVVNNDGTKEYHEVKGMETDTYKLKRKLLKACRPDINYIVVKV